MKNRNVYGLISLLFIVFALTSIGTEIITPLWPIYIRSLGASMVQIGFIFSISSALSALLQIPSGWLSDRYGRKWLNITGILLGVLPPLLYIMAKDWTQLIPGVLLAGFSMGLYSPVRWSLVADLTTIEARAKTYSWMIIAATLGSVIGPILGGVIADIYGLKTPFLLYFLLMVLSLPPALLLKGETVTPSKGGSTTSMKTTEDSFLFSILLFACIDALQGVSTGIITPLTPIFLVNAFSVDLGYVGFILAISLGLATVIVQIPGGWLAGKLNRKSLLTATFIFSAPFYAFFALSRNILEAFISLFLANAIISISWPGWMGLLMEITPSKKRGLVNGVIATSWWTGYMSGNALSGLLWMMGVTIPYYTAALFVLISVLPTFFLSDRRQRASYSRE